MVCPVRYSRQVELVIVSHRFGARKLWGFGRGPRCGQIRGDSGETAGTSAHGLGFEFGRGVAISNERVRSRSSCGVTTRDECTKRDRRAAWRVQTFVMSQSVA